MGHYRRLLRHGDINGATIPRKNFSVENKPLILCSLPDCNNQHYGKGYCAKHWQKFSIYGDPLGGTYGKRPKDIMCEVEGCNSPVTAKMLCRKHYTRFITHGDPHYVCKRGPKQ
jgi:hypothetical protein